MNAATTSRMESKRALRLRSFAESMDISESLARRWMREGKIETFRIGKFIMVPVTEIDRLMRAAA